MEIHQVRYFLALSRSLNFTRAAVECHVTQPALSRGILQLEAELGGELVRREGKLTHLTSLGQTVLPALQQCYDASLRAKSLANSFLKEGHAPLNVGLSRSIDLNALSAIISEVAQAFPRIEIGIARGPAREISEKLKSGTIDLAVAGPFDEDWDRFEVRPLFRQQFGLVLGTQESGRAAALALQALRGRRILACPECAITDRLFDELRRAHVDNVARHEVPQLDDVAGLVRAGFGIGVMPTDRDVGIGLQFADVDGMDLSRMIHVVTVAGRPRPSAASAMIALLRANAWPKQAAASSRAMRTLQ